MFLNLNISKAFFVKTGNIIYDKMYNILHTPNYIAY
jgi:hypothetical protein